MHVLLATDASWLVDDVVAALGGPDTSFTVCSDGRAVSKVVTARSERDEPIDLGIFDLQIGSMGGMAVTMALRLDASAGAAPEIPVLMLLDRVADVHLARRSGAEGWLVKPLDPLRLRRAAKAVLGGGTYTEGLTGAPAFTAPARHGDPGEETLGAEPAPPEAATAG
ncbi:MAG: hypothetical protein M3487_07545 [Actinomycetota bacterium]|nr:hypothetical protein [Actinomycetota bacterium]